MSDRRDPPKSAFGKKSTAEQVTAGIDLRGKTAVITGVNSGLGLETMRVLSLRGAHVIGTARTMEKAKAACDSVEGKTTPLVCELTDFESVTKCADEIRAMGMPIDILICNAGIMAVQDRELIGEFEKQFAVNHMAHFIFVHRLLDQVRAADEGRVVMLSSSGHKAAPPEGIRFKDLSFAEGYRPFLAYGQSKLANLLMAKELDRQLAGSNATANAVHPGLINTNLGRHFPKPMLFVASLVGWAFMKSVPQGAATTCYVATSPDLSGVGGYYFSDCNPAESSPQSQDSELAAKLWTESEAMAAKWLSP